MFKLVNRNDPCWCGSGKKYKRCHYESDQRLKVLVAQGYPMPAKKIIKTADQIEGIRKSCQLTKKLLDGLNDLIKPGVTTNELDQWVYDQTLQHGATPAPLGYKGFPKSICTSINEVVCHGIPEDRTLIDGDIINVDITCILDGYYGDSCRMYCVGNVSQEAQQLIKVTKQCLEAAISTLKPFDSIGVVGETIQRIAKQHNYGVVEMFGGHGVGNEFHEEPFVYHCARNEKQMICVPGMIFTIEPMINMGKPDCKILSDGWTAVTQDGSLSAQWEHTVLVTADSIDVLT